MVYEIEVRHRARRNQRANFRFTTLAVFLVDTNVLSDLANADSAWFSWSRQTLGESLRRGSAGTNPIIYAELSVLYESPGQLDAALAGLGLHRWPLPYEAAFLAGRAFLMYRRSGGARSSPLPDFYIGAHAAVSGLTVVTRDPRRFRSYFPTVPVVAPTSA